MKKNPRTRVFNITIRVVSEEGTRPDVRTLGGDTVFVSMQDGQSCTWKCVAEKSKTEMGVNPRPEYSRPGGPYLCPPPPPPAPPPPSRSFDRGNKTR